MKINFKYSGEITSDILTKLELPLHMAKKFLEKIPHSLSNKTGNRAEFEMMAEGFLLFMIVARGRLLQEINQALPSGDRLCKRDVGLDSLLEKLKNNHNQNFQKIKIMIEETAQKPKKNINSQGEDLGWKREKTWLWEINVTDRFHEVQARMTFQAAFLVFLIPIAWLLPAIANELMMRAV